MRGFERGLHLARKGEASVVWNVPRGQSRGPIDGLPPEIQVARACWEPAACDGEGPVNSDRLGAAVMDLCGSRGSQPSELGRPGSHQGEGMGGQILAEDLGSQETRSAGVRIGKRRRDLFLQGIPRTMRWCRGRDLLRRSLAQNASCGQWVACGPTTAVT
jgi:hypothetical protein